MIMKRLDASGISHDVRSGGAFTTAWSRTLWVVMASIVQVAVGFATGPRILRLDFSLSVLEHSPREGLGRWWKACVIGDRHLSFSPLLSAAQANIGRSLARTIPNGDV